MKKVLLGICLALLLFSCRKANEISSLTKQAVGTWELEESVCGICTNPYTTFPPGNNNLLILSANGAYEKRKQDTVLSSGSYSIISSKECNKSGDPAMMINTTTGSGLQFIQISNDKLTLSTPACYADGVVNTYHRVK